MNEDDKSTQAVILSKIKASCKEDRLVPFIGSGFSVNIDGYPDWKDFLNILSTKININLNEIFKNPNEATEFYIWHCAEQNLDTRREIYYSGKEEFKKSLKAEFNNNNLVNFGDNDNWKQHIMLVKKFSKIYTTNWDKALEITASNICNGGTKIFSDERDIVREPIEGSQGTSNFKLIKFHGDCWSNKKEAICSLMAGETDYFERMSMGHKVDSLFWDDLINGKDFLFIGYSFSDPNIKYTLSQLVRLLTSIETIEPDKPKNHLFWLVKDNPKEYDKDSIEFFNNWKKVYPYYLFKDQVDFLEYDKLEKELETLNTESTEYQRIRTKKISIIKKSLIDTFKEIGITDDADTKS